MPSAFISYRRIDSASLATLIAVRLKEIHAIDAYVDTRNTDGGGPFPDRLRGAIEQSDVFVCLLGATSLESAWVLTEIEHAHNFRKIMIPVFQERYVAPTPVPNEHVDALLQSDGVQFLDVRNLYIDQAIAQLADVIRNSVPRRSFIRPAIGLITLVLAVALLALVVVPALAPKVTPTSSANTLPASEISSSSQTNSQTIDLAATQTQEAYFTAQQADALVTDTYATQVAQSQGTAQAANLELTHIVETQSSQSTDVARETIVAGTNVAGTETSQQSEQFIGPVKHNADWQHVYKSFFGVDMVLVPKGCFMMGNDGGSDDEKPANPQCFDQPFWIDRYEVTNQQYGSDGYFSGDKHPRDSVIWFEARDFCAARNGARLPTEREWEYAARGPDNLVYPWGNNFVEDNTIHAGNSNDQSAEVGSRPDGDSWVGAADLSGNL